MISLLLGEPEGGVKYFFANCKEAAREIVLYKALDYVDYVGDDRQWMWVYVWGEEKDKSQRAAEIGLRETEK